MAIMPPLAGVVVIVVVIGGGSGLVVVVVGGVDVVAYDFDLRLRKRSEDIYSSMRRPDGESDDDPYSR